MSGLKLIEAGEPEQPETVIARVQISCEVLQIKQIHFSSLFPFLKPQSLVFRRRFLIPSCYMFKMFISPPFPALIRFHGAKGKSSERRLAVSSGYLLDTAATFTAPLKRQNGNFKTGRFRRCDNATRPGQILVQFPPLRATFFPVFRTFHRPGNGEIWQVMACFPAL